MIAALLSLALVAAPPSGGAPAGAPVKVAVVAVESEPGARLVAGTTAAVDRAVLSTRVAARIARVHAAEGQPVRRGDLLVTLADEDLRGAVSGAEAARAAAAAHERRIRALLAQDAATPAELDQAVAQRAQAEAALAAARANLGYAGLRAPFDGVVQARRANAGDLVGPGQPVLEVEGRALELQATLSEEEARGVARGTRLPFDAGSRSGVAEVTALAAGADPLSHRVALRARIVEGGDGLRSGAFVRLRVPSPAAAALWVPRSALVERGDLTGVFVAEDGRATLRWLALGEAAGDRVPVRAGLRPGERVIATPGGLRDGAAVEVADGR
jgi:RND family efflux transporter MFP subunit